MFSIEPVETTDSRFHEVEERFTKALTDYLDYSDQRSKLSGKVKVTSNKAQSYKNRLIRLIIAYEKTNNIKITDLESLETFQKLNDVRNKPGFKEFNSSNNNFFSAALSEYERFLKDNRNNIENEIDNKINENILENENNNEKVVSKSLIKNPQSKKEKIRYKSNYIYPRNISEALFAKEKANWTCEVNENHQTFTTNSGKQYVETHHLIPLSFQDEYENTIDFADNLVALCPTCHQLIHHAVIEEREPILRKLFEERESKYPKYGIDLTFDNLLQYYK